MKRSRSDHIGFKEHTFEKDIVSCKSSKYSLVNSFGDFLAMFNGVSSIRQNFRLNDRYDSVILTNGGVSSKTPSIFLNSLVRW